MFKGLEFKVITPFAHLVECYFKDSILGRAITSGKLQVDFINPRDFTKDKHKTIDDKPYGGGPGMVYMIEPFVRALTYAQRSSVYDHIITVLFEPKGKVLTQEFIEGVAKRYEAVTFILLLPRYEGIDARIKNYVDYVVSVGPYILTGAELAGAVFMDSISRYISGVLGNVNSLDDESSFFVRDDGVYIRPEADVFTRPRVFQGHRVPEVLLSGDHATIRKFKSTEVRRVEFLREKDVK